MNSKLIIYESFQSLFNENSKFTLFYPCSGYDINSVIYSMRPYVNKFIFCDPVFNSVVSNEIQKKDINKRFIIKYEELTGEYLTQNNRKQEIIVYDIQKVKFFDTLYFQEFEVNYYRKDAKALILEGDINFNIFFYRGDSQGEAGSGINWLDTPLISNILEKVQNNGFILSDGNNSGFEYSTMRKLSLKEPDMFMNSKFYDNIGNKFKLIGYINKKHKMQYTLLWSLNTDNS